MDINVNRWIMDNGWIRVRRSMEYKPETDVLPVLYRSCFLFLLFFPPLNNNLRSARFFSPILKRVLVIGISYEAATIFL